MNLGVSQSRLARLSGVSRFRICVSELGERQFTEDEAARVEEALLREAARMRAVLDGVVGDRAAVSATLPSHPRLA